MKLPDGFVFRLSSSRKGTAIKITEEKLICCKHCEHSYDILEPEGDTLCCSYWEDRGEAERRIRVDPDGFCSNAKE